MNLIMLNTIEDQMSCDNNYENIEEYVNQAEIKSQMRLLQKMTSRIMKGGIKLLTFLMFRVMELIVQASVTKN